MYVCMYVVGSQRLMPLDALQPKDYLEMAGNFDRKLRLPRIHFRVLLHAANMRHGTNGKLKNPTALTGFEPANLGTKGQHATSRPPMPLYTEIDGM